MSSPTVNLDIEVGDGVVFVQFGSEIHALSWMDILETGNRLIAAGFAAAMNIDVEPAILLGKQQAILNRLMDN
jgi:hypothetical protein